MNPADRLIIEQQPYVRALARNIAKHLPAHADFEELVAFGQLGLVEAARQFDPTRGVSFTTFAHYRIRGAIFDGLRKMTWLPPAARRQVHEHSVLNDALEHDADKLSASDDPRYLARQFSEAVERLGAVYLMSSIVDDDSTREGPADSGAAPTTESEGREIRGRLRDAIDSLPPDDAALVRMLYLEQKSMSEVGAILNKNKSTICRRHAEAIAKLRQCMGEDAPAPVLPSHRSRRGVEP
ncbi:MAG: sigma-70 family RNA polymerase sigma factor [Phycisphaeraceae bacterium]|nr:sigma-70 family RNA polymerase sigma factor [Phycisphaeraceae bacterium]